MSTESKALYEFKKQVKALKKFQGRGTELISVYISPGYPVSEITGKLRDEFGQASNIKSATTRKNVQGALERMMHFLKGVNKPPENGIAVFCGNVSETEGRIDIQIYSVVPPMPLTTQFYRCESKFVLEPLEDLLEHTDTYGLVVMDGKDATVAILKGKQISVVKKLESTAHQKVNKGGQCIHENSVVLTSTGAKTANEIKEGDSILSFDFKTNKTVFSNCEKVMKRTASEELVVETDYPKKYLKLTGEHVVFVLTGVGIMEKRASELTRGDVLLAVSELSQNFVKAIIEKVTKQKASSEFYFDFDVPATRCFVANGLIVHNSAARYDRLHIEGVEFYYSRIGEAMNALVGLKNFKGVIIGGPGPAKEDFSKQKPFNYQLKVLGVVDTGYTDEYGLREILEKSGEIMAEQEAIVEKRLIDEFLREQSNNGLVAYGLENAEKALDVKQASRLLVSENMDLKRVKYHCSSCGKDLERFEERADEDAAGIPCECGGHFKIVEMQDVINDIIGKAEEQGVPVIMISRDTAEGRQFYGTFKGVGVFLRYRS